jgi:uncharacterized protein with ParB-like and HNH nuclease domain
MIETENNLGSDDPNFYEGEDQDQDASYIDYDISASPNDFNIATLFSFIGSGIVKIPGFQRNYVWDIKRASKLIESILMGIPIPQIFLYEEQKNKFLVIDGQQRYFTIYFFKNQRFPKVEKRIELRKIFDESETGFSYNILNNNEYFSDFNLKLPEQLPDVPNKFNKLSYSTLSEIDRGTLDLRTIRSIIVKQNHPDDDDSVMFEIFNRLNTGGINLKPQEIRTSLYHSEFYTMLYNINLDLNWRRLTPQTEPDLNMKDIEILLRGFAMLEKYENYRPSLTKFLNIYSKEAKSFSKDKIKYLEQLFRKFSEVISGISEQIFFSNTGRFNISVYESIFVALCTEAYRNNNLEVKETTLDHVNNLKDDTDFLNATLTSTANKANVLIRITKAKEIL